MPLTPAHAAAVLPLGRRFSELRLLSALVIGSVAPDFEYHLRFGIPRSATHSLSGLLGYVLPMGLAAYALFHALLRQPLEDLLPDALRMRLQAEQGCRNRAPDWRFARLLQVACAILVGGVTHLLWDACTHGNGFVVERVPILSTLLAEVGQYPIRVYKVLQHGSSIFGLSYIAWCVRDWVRRAPALANTHTAPDERSDATRRGLARGVILGASLIVGLGFGLTPPSPMGWLQRLQYFLGASFIAGVSTLCLTLSAYCLLWQIARWRRA